MNDTQGVPAPPPDRDLPDHQRIREELLMKIEPDDKHASLPRRWGLPLAVAAGVAAASLTAVAVFGGHGTAKPALAADDANANASAHATSNATSPSPSSGRGRVSPPAGAGATPSSAPASSTVTSTTTTPIDARTVARILASCLGADASTYHPVIAVRTPVASQDRDGTVIAVDSAGRYVQCETKGDRGTSPDVPPTFINNRLWGTGHIIEYFDSTGQAAGPGRYLALGAGHHTSNVARITVSYGEDPRQYPAVMAGGAFFYAAAFSTDSSAAGPLSATSTPYVHAYDAAGKEIYDQKKDPQFNPNHQ